MKLDIKGKFVDINFDYALHKYISNGTEYISVTTILDQFKPEFDRDKVSTKIAKRDRIPQDVLLGIWSIKGALSRAIGHEFHLYVDAFLKHKYTIPIITGIQSRIDEFHRFWEIYDKSVEFVDSEVVVADHNLRIAGTIDCIIRNKNTGKYRILDWKTNEKIVNFNKYEKMLKPLNHLASCNFYTYSLQLALYKRILLNTFPDIEMDPGALVHFVEGEKFKVIFCSDMEKEMQSITEYRLGQLKN